MFLLCEENYKLVQLDGHWLAPAPEIIVKGTICIHPKIPSKQRAHTTWIFFAHYHRSEWSCLTAPFAHIYNSQMNILNMQISITCEPCSLCKQRANDASMCSDLKAHIYCMDAYLCAHTEPAERCIAVRARARAAVGVSVWRCGGQERHHQQHTRVRARECERGGEHEWAVLVARAVSWNNNWTRRSWCAYK